MEYTWPQFLGFSKAVATDRNSRSVELFSLLLTAQRGDKKAIDNLFETYQRG